MTLDIERERREFEAAINDMPPISEEDMMEICGSDQTSFAFTMWLAAKRAMLGSAEPDQAFWDWLPLAYGDAGKGGQSCFTKFNMEVAFHAGRQSAPPSTDAKDSERYRWMREQSSVGIGLANCQSQARPATFIRFPLLEGTTLDAAIDAAIAAKEAGK